MECVLQQSRVLSHQCTSAADNAGYRVYMQVQQMLHVHLL